MSSSLDRRIYSFFKKGALDAQPMVFTVGNLPGTGADAAALKIIASLISSDAGTCKFGIWGNMTLNTGALVAEIWGGYSKTQLSGGQATGQTGAHYFEFIVDSGVANCPSFGVIQLAAFINGALNAEHGFITFRDYGTNPLTNLFNIMDITSGAGKLWNTSSLRIRLGGSAYYIPISPYENRFALQPTGVLGTDNIAGVGIYSQNDATSFFQNTGNDKRSYLLRVQAYRPATLPMGDGVHGVDDAAIFGLYRSYAADAAYCQQRGLNVSVNHRGTTGGSIGNSIGTNASTSTALAGDCVTLSMNNECYALSVAGVSGVLDLMHTHEGANAGGGEFILRLRNAKKNGSALGAFILFDTSLATTALSYGIDMNGASIGTAEIRLANGMVIQSVSTAVSDGDATSLPASSLVVTSHNTGKGTLFISDGSNLQAIALA